MPTELIPPNRQAIGAPCEDFCVASIGGQEFNLATLLRNHKGAVVVFWSSVCSHCMRYDSYLNEFEWSHPDLRLVAIASRQGETPDQLRASALARQLRFDILHDPDGRVAERWCVRQTPRVFLISAAGVLLYRGAIDNYKYPNDIDYAPYLEPAVEQFLADRPLARTETASFGCAIKSVYYNFPKAL